ALARVRPLALGAHALADRGAFDLGLVEAVHHLGSLTLLVGPLVSVDAIALLDLLADALRRGRKLLADRLLVGFIVPALEAVVLDLGAILAVDELHVGGARGGLLGAGARGLLDDLGGVGRHLGDARVARVVQRGERLAGVAGVDVSRGGKRRGRRR